jgi:hypothetical protein
MILGSLFLDMRGFNKVENQGFEVLKGGIIAGVQATLLIG